jgi:hypothetical protein
MSEGFISRGFRGRQKPGDQSGRIPPDQYLERGFPVLSAWDFSIVGEVDQPKRSLLNGQTFLIVKVFYDLQIIENLLDALDFTLTVHKLDDSFFFLQAHSFAS